MDSVLKPCPFCGEAVTLRFDADGGIAGCHDAQCAGFVNATPAEWNRRLAVDGGRAAVLERALRGLYEHTADYIRVNRLGDVHHNQVMKAARDALSPHEPRTPKNCRPLDEYVAELEQDPVMKAALDKARAELRAELSPPEAGVRGPGTATYDDATIKAREHDAPATTVSVAHTVEDGFGGMWYCIHGYPEAKCGLQVVRPGKVQCDVCDEQPATPETVRVPVEPTEAMRRAGGACIVPAWVELNSHEQKRYMLTVDAMWRDMLAAAQSAKQRGGVE